MKLEGFIGPTYVLEHPSASSQRLVNLYAEAHEAGPRKGNVARFVNTPGLRKRATLGSGPIRGVHRAATGQLFVVSGTRVFELTSHFDVAERSGALLTTTGRVTMADDGVRLVIADGGSTAYESALPVGSPVAPIPEDCPGGHVAWQDGYFIHTVPSTGRFAISGLNELTYDALDTATAEGRPDLLVMLVSVNRQLWLFGEATTEVWWNSGDADFPFARIESAFIETGTIAAGTCVRTSGSVAWVGNDERGRGTVWHAQGVQAARISTHAVEFALSGYSRLNEASAFAYQQGGHEFYQLTIPGTGEGAEAGGTWVYDFSTGLWHERSFLDAEDGEQPHRAWVGTVAHGEVVVGDREDGRLYTYETDYFFDDGGPIRRLRQAPHVSQDEKRLRFNGFELQTEAGVGLTAGPPPSPVQGSAPVALLSWSDDGGHTWSNEHESSMGEIGRYLTRVKWRRLGVGRDRVFRVATSEPVPVSWLGAEIDVVQLER
jgi:hypothetical protein